MKARELNHIELSPEDKKYIRDLIKTDFGITHEKSATFIAIIQTKFLNEFKFKPENLFTVSGNSIIADNPELIKRILLKPEKQKNTKVGNPPAFKRNEFIELTIQKCNKFLTENGFTGSQTDILYFTALVMVHLGLFKSPLNYEYGVEIWRIDAADFLHNYINFLQDYIKRKLLK